MPIQPSHARCATICLFAFSASAAAQNWPSFRGPNGSGIGNGSPPAQWNVETGANVKWKTRIVGLGHSSPIVWGDRVYVTTATTKEDPAPDLKTGWLGGSIEPLADDQEWTWKVLCLDKANGKILWEKDACSGLPRIQRHPKSSHANATPATDGRHVVAFFGSEGLYAFDPQGALLWKKDLGPLKAAFYMVPTAEWGFGSSPIIHAGQVIVQCDVLDGGFWASFDVQTGRELRRVPRTDVPTWCTPAICDAGGHTQVICNGFKHMGGYDLDTGAELWKLAGGGDIPVPTPQVAQGLIFLTSGHSRSPIFAVRADARGDLTPASNKPKSGDQKAGDESAGEQKSTDQRSSDQQVTDAKSMDRKSAEQQSPAPEPGEKSSAAARTGDDPTSQPAGLAWSQGRYGAYMPTPLVLGDNLYIPSDNGMLTVLDIRTGAQRYRHRIKDAGVFTASVVAADGRLYCTNEDGEVFVLKAGNEYELLARNSLHEACLATPAISDGLLLIRGRDYLYCLGR